MPNEAEIALVRASWATIAADDDQAASVGAVFYAQLFARHPEFRALFPMGSLAMQARKLTQMIAVAVGALDRLDTIAPAVEALARRHVGYGVQDAHYDAVGAALLDALAIAHGASFTPALRAAWGDTYGTIAGVMRRAGSAHEADRGEARERATLHRAATSAPTAAVIPTC